MAMLTLATLLLTTWAPLDVVCQDATAAAAPADGAPVWFDGSYNDALRAARDGERLVLLVFAPTWSDYSNRLRDETLVDAAVEAELTDVLCLMVDPDDARGVQVARRHQVTSFPALVVVDAQGRTEDRVDGFIPPGPLVGELRRIRSGQDTVSAFRARADADPDDLSLADALASKLLAVGEDREAGRVLDGIRRRDPEGRTTSGARLLIGDALDAFPADGTAQDLAAVRAVIEGVHDERGRFEGYARLADLARLVGDDDASLAAWHGAWERIPDGLVLDWGNDLTFQLVARRQDLDDDERAFLLEVAETVAARAESAIADGAAPALPAGGSAQAWLATRLDGLAWACFTSGQTDRAVQLAQRCLALDPDNEEYPGRLALFRADG